MIDTNKTLTENFAILIENSLNEANEAIPNKSMDSINYPFKSENEKDWWKEYESTLKSYRWGYIGSIDRKFWSKGRKEYETLTQMYKKLSDVDKNKANTIWNKAEGGKGMKHIGKGVDVETRIDVEPELIMKAKRALIKYIQDENTNLGDIETLKILFINLYRYLEMNGISDIVSIRKFVKPVFDVIKQKTDGKIDDLYSLASAILDKNVKETGSQLDLATLLKTLSRDIKYKPTIVLTAIQQKSAI